MAQIRSFAAIRYARSVADRMSDLVAPPYDVLEAADKSALLQRHHNNIVKVDLPHLPAKTPGPDEVYDVAAAVMRQWLADGVLIRDPRPALYPYAQTYESHGKTHHRRGLFALVRLSPFGAGDVVPHEKTYPGAIKDRLKLMRATRAQLSPIFGLFHDPANHVTSTLWKHLGKPEVSALLQGVRNDLWSVTDAEVENQVIDFFKSRSIYIADGHHRYTTALAYQAEAAERHGGELPPHHSANYCLFVLISMQDDGLRILPTHRLIGGLSAFNIDRFRSLVAGKFEVAETPLRSDHVDELADTLVGYPPHTFGLYDGRTRRLYTLALQDPDILKPLEPDHSEAWRRLDVAILQRYLLDEVIRPHFAGGAEPTRGYTADPHAIAPQVDGEKYQIALLLRPTPLQALEELGRHNEVMPQKSTYFYPKLATGMVINPLE